MPLRDSPTLRCVECTLPIQPGSDVVFARKRDGPGHYWCRQWRKPHDVPIPCEGCGRPVWTVWLLSGDMPVPRKLCSLECSIAVGIARAKRPVDPRACLSCEAVFTPARRDQTTCSSRCRQALYRRRRSGPPVIR